MHQPGAELREARGAGQTINGLVTIDGLVT